MAFYTCEKARISFNSDYVVSVVQFRSRNAIQIHYNDKSHNPKDELTFNTTQEFDEAYKEICDALKPKPAPTASGKIDLN